MSDDDYRRIVYAPMGILNRQEIKKLAGLSDQAIKKNAKVKAELRSLENGLRARGVLPPLTVTGEKAQTEPKLYDKAAKRTGMDSRRMALLESENHDLKVQVEKLQKENERLHSKLASSRETVDAITDGLTVFMQCPS
jgi:hypothetical protein